MENESVCSPLYLKVLGSASFLGSNLTEVQESLFSQEDQLNIGRQQLGRAYACLEDIRSFTSDPRSIQFLKQCVPGNIQSELCQFPPERIGVILGACNAGTLEVEKKTKQAIESESPTSISEMNLNAGTQHIKQVTGARGPAYTISNACASGLMAITAGTRLIHAGIVDAVVCGGFDTKADLPQHGFSALEAVSEKPSSPFRKERAGINLAEGGALFLLSKSPSELEIAGSAETADAYHMSAPNPDGIEACRAMRVALERAGIAPNEIDLVVAHGTGTKLNDSMEAKAISSLFGNSVPVASIKHLTGHTLGGAGALQVIAAAALLLSNPNGKLIANARGEIDPEIAPIHLVEPNEQLGRPLRNVLVNAFAFGGSNVSMVLRRGRTT